MSTSNFIHRVAGTHFNGECELTCGEVLLVLQPILHADVEVTLLFTDGEVFPTMHRKRKHIRLLLKDERSAVAL